MALDLRNFVQVNINYHLNKYTKVERGIVTLITKNSVFQGNSGKVYYSYSDFKNDYSESSLNDYVYVFFNNNGKALKIIYATNIDTGLSSLNYTDTLIVLDLNTNQFTLSELNNFLTTEHKAKNIHNLNSDLDLESDQGNTVIGDYTGINEKMFLVSATAKPTEQALIYNSNVAVKIGEPGSEMLMAAYLSKINLNVANSIYGYNYTIENLKKSDGTELDGLDTVTNATISEFENTNYNTILVNNTVNIGGNTLSGTNLVNYYLKIILTQTVTEKVMTILASKIKFNQIGVNRVYNAIVQDLNNYVTNGYLQTDFIWTKENLDYKFRDTSLRICSQSEVLEKGYKVVIFPISSLSTEDKDKGIFPPIYIVLADSRDVRYIVINGDVY